MSVVGNRVVSVRSCQKLPPWPTQPWMDPLLAKAEPISNGGNASVITDVRKKKSYCTDVTVLREERGENT